MPIPESANMEISTRLVPQRSAASPLGICSRTYKRKYALVIDPACADEIPSVSAMTESRG